MSARYSPHMLSTVMVAVVFAHGARAMAQPTGCWKPGDTFSKTSTGDLQSVSLLGAAGIRDVIVEGEDLCIEKVCWKCPEALDPPGCVRPSSYFAAPATGLDVVDMGSVRMEEARTAAGSPIALD